MADTQVSVDLISLPEAAKALDLDITGVHQLIKDGQLVVARDAQDRRCVPREFISEGVVVKSLPAVIRLLRDCQFSDPEIIRWLFTPDPTLPGTAVQALLANRGTEIKRRAQAAG